MLEESYGNNAEWIFTTLYVLNITLLRARFTYNHFYFTGTFSWLEFIFQSVFILSVCLMCMLL